MYTGRHNPPLVRHEVPVVRESTSERSTAQGSWTRRAILRTLGHCTVPDLLDAGACAQILSDTRRCMSGPEAVRRRDGAERAIGLLQESAAALALLDDERLGALVDAALGPDAILSRIEAVCGTLSSWQQDFSRVRAVLPPRAFRSGVSTWIPLQPATMEVLAGSQHLEPDGDPAASLSSITTVTIGQGSLVVLEGGVRYRTMEPGDWLCLMFVRPWLKPDILYSAALTPDRIARLGERGRRWCGMDLGLPTSVEAFLQIEDAALAGTVGRAKGSGI